MSAGIRPPDLREFYGMTLSLAQIAAWSGLTPDCVERIARRHPGQPLTGPVTEYVEHRRQQEVARLNGIPRCVWAMRLHRDWDVGCAAMVPVTRCGEAQ